MLLAINLIPTSGIAARALQNVGSLKNTGLEIAVNTVNIAKPDFEWRSGFNIAFNRNEILSLGPYPELLIDVPGGQHTVTNEVILQPGRPIGTFYGYQTDGIRPYTGEPPYDNLNEAGRRIIVDQDGNGIINDNDRAVLGNALPLHTGGFTNDIRYKGFDLSLFFDWSYGNKVYNAERVYLEEFSGGARNLSRKMLNAWTVDNQDTDLPMLGRGEINRFTDAFIEDGSFLRVRNITLGYSLDDRWLARTPLSRARIYVSGQNLFTLTNYTGYNPQSNTSTIPVAPGIDWGAYPLARIYTMGINIQF